MSTKSDLQSGNLTLEIDQRFMDLNVGYTLIDESNDITAVSSLKKW
jgi:hypothetical protein